MLGAFHKAVWSLKARIDMSQQGEENGNVVLSLFIKSLLDVLTYFPYFFINLIFQWKIPLIQAVVTMWLIEAVCVINVWLTSLYYHEDQLTY